MVYYLMVLWPTSRTGQEQWCRERKVRVVKPSAAAAASAQCGAMSSVPDFTIFYSHVLYPGEPTFDGMFFFVNFPPRRVV